MPEMVFPDQIEALLKKFSKIDKKFVSQSILEVGPFTFHRVWKKMVFFETRDFFLYWKFNSKFDAFWSFSKNLVVFFQTR